MLPPEILNTIGAHSIPIMAAAIALAAFNGIVFIGVCIRHRRMPGQWIHILIILTCIYMIVFYSAKLLGLSPYNPAGLVGGIIPVISWELAGLWYGAYQW